MLGKVRFSTLILSGVLVFAGLPALGQEKKPDAPKAGGGETQTVESKKEKAAAIPDFANAYGLTYESIASVGTRLGEARHKSDPVALGMIATELGIAEKVSGKTASLTSADVMKEAIEMAKLRRQEKELVALSLMTPDKATAEELTSLAKKAYKDESERIAKFKSGERERGFRTLWVFNNTDQLVFIRANHHHIGSVAPWSSFVFNTPFLAFDPEVHLHGHSPTGGEWRNRVFGNYATYIWNLYP